MHSSALCSVSPLKMLIFTVEGIVCSGEFRIHNPKPRKFSTFSTTTGRSHSSSSGFFDDSLYCYIAYACSYLHSRHNTVTSRSPPIIVDPRSSGARGKPLPMFPQFVRNKLNVCPRISYKNLSFPTRSHQFVFGETSGFPISSRLEKNSSATLAALVR